jgi:hypothetical protein
LYIGRNLWKIPEGKIHARFIVILSFANDLQIFIATCFFFSKPLKMWRCTDEDTEIQW